MEYYFVERSLEEIYGVKQNNRFVSQFDFVKYQDNRFNILSNFLGWFCSLFFYSNDFKNVVSFVVYGYSDISSYGVSKSFVSDLFF